MKVDKVSLFRDFWTILNFKPNSKATSINSEDRKKESKQNYFLR